MLCLYRASKGNVARLASFSWTQGLRENIYINMSSMTVFWS